MKSSVIKALVCLCLGWASVSLAEVPGGQLQSVLDQLKSLSGHFTQSKLDPATGERVVQSSGEMLLQRPGLFRWHYDKPYEQIIVADGKNVWFYDVDLDQVSVREAATTLVGSPAAVLVGAEPISDKFEVIAMGNGDRLVWYRLIPKAKDGSYRQIDMALQDGHIASLRMDDEFGRHMELAFSDVKTNPSLDPKLFTFVPPEGVDVVGQSQP